jgi:hypothetical protein
MKQVIRFDKDGFYVEPVLLQDKEEIPSDCTEVIPTGSFVSGQFVDGQWIEGASQEEIDAIKNVPQLPSDEERIAALEEALLLLMME